MSQTTTFSSGPMTRLRGLARRSEPEERCELCGTKLAQQHQHLFEPPGRRLYCACDACALLFDTRTTKLRRVPRDVHRLPDFTLTDADWQSLRVPVSLAFLYLDSATGTVLAAFPSPAGATEAEVAAEAWERLVATNPALANLEPDVEALLIYRVQDARQYFRVPIDQCFTLVGLIRTHWRGFSGGDEVWREIARFFQLLQRQAVS